jgi:hypothetical protein
MTSAPSISELTGESVNCFAFGGLLVAKLDSFFALKAADRSLQAYCCASLRQRERHV